MYISNLQRGENLTNIFGIRKRVQDRKRRWLLHVFQFDSRFVTYLGKPSPLSLLERWTGIRCLERMNNWFFSWLTIASLRIVWIPIKIDSTIVQGSRIRDSFSKSSFQIRNIHPRCSKLHSLTRISSQSPLPTVMLSLWDRYIAVWLKSTEGCS